MGLAYLGGLLHNFGYLVLAHVFPPHFSLICRHLEANRQLDHQVIEHHLLGITREQIGAALMRCWEMPEEVVTALRFQGDPGYQGEQAVYPNLIFLAVQLLRAGQAGVAVPGAVQRSRLVRVLAVAEPGHLVPGRPHPGREARAGGGVGDHVAHPAGDGHVVGRRVHEGGRGQALALGYGFAIVIAGASIAGAAAALRVRLVRT